MSHRLARHKMFAQERYGKYKVFVYASVQVRLIAIYVDVLRAQGNKFLCLYVTKNFFA